MKFLYIEDDPNIAEIYLLMIKDQFEGIDINHFLDGKKAIEELKQNHQQYSLIISDFKLSDITGADIFKFVSGQMLGIPFIILSGYDCSKDEKLKMFFDSHVRNALLIKPVSIEELTKKIRWCLAGEKDLLKIYNKNATHFDEKVPLNSNVFLKVNYVPCDVYLKLGDGKYVKIINKKELFESKMIQKLIIKGVDKFYVNRSELSDYGESVISSLNLMIKTKKNKIDDTQKSQLASKGLELLKSNLLKCGFSEVLMNTTDELVDMQLELIKTTPKLSGFLEKFQNYRLAYTDHTRIISYVIVGILRDLEWESETTLHRMCLAAVLHDLSLPENLLKITLTDEQIDSLSEEDKKIYYRHPEESAHLAKNFEITGGGLEQFILEHHEQPDGKGFPRKLTYNHIHPLSAVLHMADFVADLMWLNDFDTDKVKKTIKEKRNYYHRGFYRKPYEAVCRMMEISNW